MSDPSLDDRFKQAQIDKTYSEIKKIEKEAEAIRTQYKNDFWSEFIKILGGIVLGVGGVVVAVTQYEVGELKAKIAKEELTKAEGARVEAEMIKTAAEADASAALMKRDVALREQKEAEAAAAELKAMLTLTDSALRSARPNETKSRLAYIQFKGELNRSLINELREDLAKKSFNAPGAERVSGEDQNIVKYFNSGDQEDANKLAETVETFFKSKGCPVKLRVTPSSSANVKNPPLEVWLAHRCTK